MIYFSGFQVRQCLPYLHYRNSDRIIWLAPLFWCPKGKLLRQDGYCGHWNAIALHVWGIFEILSRAPLSILISDSRVCRAIKSKELLWSILPLRTSKIYGICYMLYGQELLKHVLEFCCCFSFQSETR